MKNRYSYTIKADWGCFLPFLSILFVSRFYCLAAMRNASPIADSDMQTVRQATSNQCGAHAMEIRCECRNRSSLICQRCSAVMCVDRQHCTETMRLHHCDLLNAMKRRRLRAPKAIMRHAVNRHTLATAVCCDTHFTKISSVGAFETNARILIRARRVTYTQSIISKYGDCTNRRRSRSKKSVAKRNSFNIFLSIKWLEFVILRFCRRRPQLLLFVINFCHYRLIRCKYLSNMHQ